MQKIFTGVLLALSFYATAQKLPTYSKKDSTFTFSFSQSIQLAKSLEKTIELEKQVEVLEKIGGQQDIAIKKLQLRDSLCQIELNLSYDLEKDLRKQLLLNAESLGNYKALVFSAEEQLKAEKKRARTEEIWKNIYKYGYPILAGITTYLILTK